jgi:magnesium chelatase family protein
VAEARERQQRRFAATGVSCNGEMDVRMVCRYVRLPPSGQDALARAYALGTLSARGRHRVLRVARTIADLRRRDEITSDDVLMALGLRQRGGAEPALAA